MHKNFILIIASTLLAFAPQGHGSDWLNDARTLESTYQAAFNRSELISEQNELISQTEERYNQAVGSVLPSVSGVATYQRQGGGTTLFPESQPTVRLTGTQPVFRGLREFAAIRQLRQLSTAQIETKFSVGSALYNDVAQNFFTILSLERELSNLNHQIDLYGQRITELRGRIKIGRSRLSEMLTVESLQTNLKAQVEQTRGQLLAARERYAFLTGFAKETRLQDSETTPSSAASLDSYLKMIEGRPDIMAARSRAEASSESIAIARGAHFPSVDLTGDYYITRSGTLQDVKWDVIASLTVPIFAGGVIQSRVREASSQAQQSEILLARVRREAETEVRTLFEALQADLSQLGALANAKDLAEKNYSEQSREYRLGLVTNLDVLQALTSFQEAQRAFDRARYNLKYDFTRIEVATAQRPGKH